jgi:cell wall assembly regulator SMI1
MEDVVARLASWLEANAPDVASAQFPGASDEELAAFEKELGTALPAGLRALYRWHNGGKGGLIGNRKLMSLADVTKTRQLMNKAVDDGAFKTTNWYRKTWVPFLSNGAGDHVCWDPRGSFSGEPGQVLEFWQADHERKVLAPTLDGWLTAIVESMEAGVWRLDSDEGVTDDHGFSEFVAAKFPGFPKLAIDSDGKRPKRAAPLPKVDADPTRETKTYKASERFAVADTITHPQFGTGVVQRVHDTAIDVLFESGPRTLVHAKGATGGLTKPKPFDHSKGPTRV